MPSLESLLADNWCITFEPSHNRNLPYLCTCIRTIDSIAPHTHRRALGTAAGETLAIALSRALTFAETNEAEVITYFTRTDNVPVEPLNDVLTRLGLNKPTLPATTPPRRL